MPYKIYTYEDPYKLNKASFWDSIASFPHFCASRTLVNGLKENMQESINGLICPLDDLVNHENIYGNWTNDISFRIHQYTVLSATFKNLLDKGQIDRDFYMSLTQNQNHFLDALRLFIELSISASSLDSSSGNKEQKLFVSMLNRLQNNSSFHFPDTPSKEKIASTVLSLARKEKDDYIASKSGGKDTDLKWFDNCIKNTSINGCDTIIVHGVHQFSPVQLRLLIEMEAQGCTIIFLFNYQKKFPKIYSSWKNIYRCFGVPIESDLAIKEYIIPSMQNPSNAFACAFGSLYEDHDVLNNNQMSQLYQLYKDIPYIKFANITEYAHFVSDHVESAKRNWYNSQRINSRGANDVPTNAQVLNFMDEQVYTANRDVHTLLKIYYPEYAKGRHFLSYPIGQFFSAIYRLWDYEAGAIKIDIPAIKECLFSNILNSGNGEILLRTFSDLEVLFEELSSYDEFQKHIVNEYLANYDNIISLKGTDSIGELKNISIYNRYIVPKGDLRALINAIEEINEIAKSLFSFDGKREDFINFGVHFKELEKFLKQRELSMATEEERTLVNALQLRLDRIKPERSTFSGTFRDLKEGLYFYLKQQDDDDAVDWIVKNFEQIDGDILQSKNQFEQGRKKVYHFACLSDYDMNKNVDQLLPWPLTDHFIQMAYSPVDLQFQVYYSTLEERSSFLKYALFYGAYYNRCDIHFSYVMQYEDEIAEPFMPLLILGLSPKSGNVESLGLNAPFTISIPKERTASINYDPAQAMDMFLCPYRYFLDYVMENAPIARDDFLYRKFYENILISAVWKRISGQAKETAQNNLKQIVTQENNKLAPYFSFWKKSEIHDISNKAFNYVLYRIIPYGQKNHVSPYNQEHMKIRRLFGDARFDIDITEFEISNPYAAFEEKAKRNYPKKEYSLHQFRERRISDEQKRSLVAEMNSYINETFSKDITAIPSDWCNYCTHKGICIECYLSNR